MDWHNINNWLPKADYAYDAKTIDTINKNRQEFDGTLFFDKIWHSIGLSQAAKHYPPKSSQELKTLWQKVTKVERPDESKQAVLFYILRDLRHGKNNLDTKFANAVYLPRKYQTLIAGLWELDHLHFQPALGHLADPSIDAEFVDDIFQVLSTHPKSHRDLALAYLSSKSPSLQNTRTLRVYFSLLLDTNVVEALQFCRTRPGQHRELFETLVSTILNEPARDLRRNRISILVSLPLTGTEETWLDEYLSTGEGSKLSNAGDVVTMRQIALGPLSSENKKLGPHHGPSIDGITWDDVRDRLQQG